eukprot:scaffold191698_cov29-Prasinocladus_malaysianus.AAC.1
MALIRRTIATVVGNSMYTQTKDSIHHIGHAICFAEPTTQAQALLRTVGCDSGLLVITDRN